MNKGTRTIAPDSTVAGFNVLVAVQGRGCGRVRDRVAAFCVDRGIDVGGDYAFDNTLWAGISRYAALLDPSLAGDPLRFRDSDIDCYGLLPVSYLEGL